jgi:hypothetical protein
MATAAKVTGSVALTPNLMVVERGYTRLCSRHHLRVPARIAGVEVSVNGVELHCGGRSALAKGGQAFEAYS